MEPILIPVDVLRERLAKNIPCICTPAFLDRSRIDPACAHHDVMDTLDELEEEYPF